MRYNIPEYSSEELYQDFMLDLEPEELLELEKLDSLDNVVYKFYDSCERLLYVGITNNFPTRYNHHKVNKEWIREVDKILVSEPLTRSEAHIYEIYYISLEKPKYNNHFSKGRLAYLQLKDLKFVTVY